jgi:hypothetical protein
MEHVEVVKIFEHCRLILGMVLSLSVARLLNGLAKFVQHPKKVKIFPVHLLWVFAILLHLVHFWWWEFKLIYIHAWTFEMYLVLILYAVDIFLLCALLFPDDLQEYSGFEDYFMSRRKWFFGIFGFSFIIDFIDTAMKGSVYFNSLGWEYPARNAIFIALCIAAMFISKVRFQLAFVLGALAYELSYIFRLYHTMQ